MVKQKGGYTSQMKAKVKYPKLKSKSAKKTSEFKIISSTQVEDITAENDETREDVDKTPDSDSVDYNGNSDKECSGDAIYLKTLYLREREKSDQTVLIHN